MSSPRIQTRWQPVKENTPTTEEPTSPLGGDDNAIKKSVIKVVPSPKIGVRTQSSDESIEQEENSNVHTQLETINEHERMLAESSCQISLPPSEATARPQTQWPVLETIEQVHELGEKERATGNVKSLLALCLHLMQSASQVDPNCNVMQTQEQSHTPRLRDKVLISLLSAIQEPNKSQSLGMAMMVEARDILRLLAYPGKISGKRGCAEAQFLIGNACGMGALGWPVNQQKAAEWFIQATKQAHPEACYRAGVCFELGLGIDKDGARAVTYYKKAAHLLHVASMYKLGVIMMRGYCGQAVSKREAVIWLQRAAAQGETVRVDRSVALPEALHALAIVQLSKECQDTSLIPDNMYAIELLKNAAKLDYAPSQFKLGQYYEGGTHVPEDEVQSIQWFHSAAKQNYAEAALAMSSWCLTGSLKTETLPQSDRQAYEWARKAAFFAKRSQLRSVTRNANYCLGVYYKNGIGVERSDEKAMKWFKRAAQLGHDEAMNLISLDKDVTPGSST